MKRELKNHHADQSRCYLLPFLWAVISTTSTACVLQQQNDDAFVPCLDCHDDDRKTSQFPNHLTEGFPTTCETCHSQNAWNPAKFDHDHFFPLDGKHATAPCASCHSKPSPLPKQCFGCHEADRTKPQFPNHLPEGFPTTCETCHSQNAWNPAKFDHDHFFPLDGKHATAPCASCHSKPSPLPKHCIGCHETDRTTAQPNHANFPTECTACHTTNGWTPSTFIHHKVNQGDHKKLTCNDCHLNWNDPKTGYSCTHCHEHNQTKMNDKHSEEQGYTWQSAACFDCHYVK